VLYLGLLADASPASKQSMMDATRKTHALAVECT